MIGATMCEGRSSASCTMYSPRSVSTTSTPACSSAAFKCVSSETIDLAFATRRTPCCLAISPQCGWRRHRFLPSARGRLWPRDVVRRIRGWRRDPQRVELGLSCKITNRVGCSQRLECDSATRRELLAHRLKRALKVGSSARGELGLERLGQDKASSSNSARCWTFISAPRRCKPPPS